MKHCHKFSPEDVYYLSDTNSCSSRYLSIGFCPKCETPVAELVEWGFDGICQKTTASGIKANKLMTSHKDEILYSVKELNYKLSKSKPYGWRYGINKAVKSGGNVIVKQYACDFYGNKELIKTYK